MSGIKHLTEIYEKKGRDFIEKLFSRELTVTENLDGSSFSFEKDFIGNNISFYKKDQENPITKVDRLLMTYYEKPIYYIESLPQEIKDEIPSGWRFGMVYFPNTKPVRIQYDELPKNHLILTHISVRNEYGEIEKTIQDKKELEDWSTKLGVENPPIIFQGKLNDEQKLEIMNFLSTPASDLKNKFRTESFSKYLISLLAPDKAKTTLGKDLFGAIDGLVFRFGEDGDEEMILAKMVDPIFLEITKDRKPPKSSYFPSDIYSLCLIDIMNYILENGIDSFDADGIEPEERYINFVFSVFKRFISDEGEKYIGADFDKPEYLKTEEFKINKEFITDPEVLSKLEIDECYEDILQMILNSLRKFKRKPQGFFTEGVIQQFNQLVGDIADYINAKKQEKIEEALGVPSFMWFKKIGTKFNPENEDENVYFDNNTITNPKIELINESESISSDQETHEEKNKEEQKEQKSTSDDASEFFSFKDFKKVVSTNKEKKKIKILNEEKQKVNLLIGKFQPFNNGHLKMSTRLKKENGQPVFLCVVHPGGEATSKFPFSQELIKKSIGTLTSENTDLFAGYKIIPSNLLEDAINHICDEVNPISVCVGESDFENAVLQREWIRKKYDLDGGDIEIFKTPKWSDNNKIRDYINNSDFQNFKLKVPKQIAVLFNEFIREIAENQKDI